MHEMLKSTQCMGMQIKNRAQGSYTSTSPPPSPISSIPSPPPSQLSHPSLSPSPLHVVLVLIEPTTPASTPPPLLTYTLRHTCPSSLSPNQSYAPPPSLYDPSNKCDGEVFVLLFDKERQDGEGYPWAQGLRRSRRMGGAHDGLVEEVVAVFMGRITIIVAILFSSGFVSGSMLLVYHEYQCDRNYCKREHERESESEYKREREPGNVAAIANESTPQTPLKKP
ncbi:hypothetical protein C0995_008108 [Termitomyces sp. Mi166|nr:hypothetical protein C0995_008108 [Termitomyces sp. Mi166\